MPRESIECGVGILSMLLSSRNAVLYDKSADVRSPTLETARLTDLGSGVREISTTDLKQRRLRHCAAPA